MSARVGLQLGGAIAGLGAGVAGVIVAIVLWGSLPATESPVTSAVTTGRQAPTGILGGRIVTPTFPDFPSPPRGALVLAQPAGTRALGLAVMRGRGPALVRVSVLSGAGSGLDGLSVSARVPGRAALQLSPCGPGCYQRTVPGAGDATRLTVSLGQSPYVFSLPAGSLRDGRPILAHAEEVWRSLRSLVWHEELSASPTDAIMTLYRAVAPDELSYSIEGASQAIIIGSNRWDRPTAAAAWIRSKQDPPVQQPVPFWAEVADAQVIGIVRRGKHEAWRVAFFDPATPGWFVATVDRSTGRTLELEMVAVAHFMHHVYSGFGRDVHIQAPR